MTAYTNFASVLSALGGSFTRASTGMYYNSSGVLTSAATNAPRFDYDPVTLLPKGILLEGARTNIALQSQFATGWSVQSSATLTPNTTTAPDGTNTAATLFLSSSSTTSAVYRAITGTAVYYTFSVYAKGSVGGEKFRFTFYNATDGTVSSSEMTCTTSWKRFSYTFAAPSIDSIWYIIQSLTETIDKTIYIWGAQLEAGDFTSSYIPTTSSTVTRAADVLTFPTSPWFNASAGTFFAEAEAMANSLLISPPILDTTADLFLYFFVGSQVATYTNPNFLGKTGWDWTQRTKAIMAYSAAGRAITFGGAPPATDANVINGSATPLKIGRQGLLHIRKIGYWPFRATDAELQRLTDP